MATLVFIFFLVYILPCILVACISVHYKTGFWVTFFISLFMTPIMGLLGIWYDRTPGGLL